MQFAVLGAPRGHADALRAALAAIDRRGILTVLHTGDVAVGGPDPAGVVSELAQHAIVGVQGEWDRCVVLLTRKEETMRARLDADQYAAVQAARGGMGARQVEWLKSLPRARRVAIDEVTIQLCHGTVSAQAGRIHPEDGPEHLRRHREQANAACIVCGKSAEPWEAVIDGVLIVCPGEMGADRARYTVIDTDRRPWGVTHACA